MTGATTPTARIHTLFHLHAHGLQESYETKENPNIPNAFFTKSQLAVMDAEA